MSAAERAEQLRREYAAAGRLNTARKFYERCASYTNELAVARAEQRYVDACARRRGLCSR